MQLMINAVAHHIPAKALKLEQDYSALGLSKSETTVFNRFYGIDSIPISEDSVLNLMKRTSEPLIKQLGNDKDKVKYIIYPRTSPLISTHGMSLVRDLAISLGLRKAIPFVLGMNKCVSTLRAFEVSEKLLASCSHGDMVLIVTGESIFTEQNRVLPNITIAADAGASALVSLSRSRTSSHRMLSMATTISGEYAKGVWMTLEQVSEFGKIFDHKMQYVVNKAVQSAGLDISDIKYILPHNVNIPCWKGFSKFSGIAIEKIYLSNISKTSHCFNSDLLLNLSTLLEENLLNKGDYYLMATVGVGAMFAAAVFQY